MCTAMTLRASNETNYIGRNMDFSYGIQPHVYFAPQGYSWRNVVTGGMMRNPYSFIGIGEELDGALAFFDGVNEHGFAAAALYFAGYAHYGAPTRSFGATQVASYDFLNYVLGNCASVEDFCAQVTRLHIVGVADPLTHTVAPLHWIATDRSGRCVVLEQTERGVDLLNNPMGVLANSPDFRWHMTNLRNYIQASPQQVEEQVWNQVKLTPFGQGGGTAALPGGYTSPERFVRTAYLKAHIPAPEHQEAALISFFQIMKSVSIPKGAVLTARGAEDYTRYTAFIDTNRCEYFFNTYDNLQIRKACVPAGTAGSALVDLGAIEQPMVYQNL